MERLPHFELGETQLLNFDEGGGDHLGLGSVFTQLDAALNSFGCADDRSVFCLTGLQTKIDIR